jgi:type II secretory pathway pseudopilin PulG
MTLNPMKPDDLERELTGLTSYLGSETELWKKAVDAAAKPDSQRVPLVRRLSSMSLRSLATAACVVLICGLLVGLLVPSLGKARQSARQLKDSTQIRGLHQGLATYGKADQEQAALGGMNENGNFLAGQVARPASAPSSRVWQESPTASDRFVIQKATIEIQTDDVRAAFAKAAHLVSDAGGEYIEASSLTGEGRAAQANLTLRVGVPRLSEVMNRLRDLGTIRSENTTGEDVTTQVVDLEARIRNEERIEKELLDLLEKRKDAPLKDILDLRTSLSSVRLTIEQLTGQRDRMSRLVSLASILVVIRAEPEPPKKP